MVAVRSLLARRRVTVDRVCARATARERVLAAMAELSAEDLELLAADAEWMLAARDAAGAEDLLEPARCSWTGRGVDGRVQCCLERGHAGEHLWRRP